MQKTPLTAEKIANFCHVTHRTVLKWIEEGKIKAYKTPGNHYRVKQNDFLDFLKKYKMPVPDTLKEITASPKKILIVDDDENMVNSIKRILRREGNFELETSYNGFDAGMKFLGFSPDVVILDIKMPKMDGYEVVRRIKEFTDINDIKVIAMSAFFEEEGKHKALSLGVDFCLDKPFKSQELLETLKKCL